ncbi:hypothetical protein B0H65DRAFT_451858 [Neurospora tetraspora]|uniref:Uncharacterized protein n=1 Tax=Neurospora tetraspora TaxID=94610 RepID=A0AAE0JQ27_9PEZI|nr:hypothetical protein B0H65DRAFT_451858 [Neurospora tetraspora]
MDQKITREVKAKVEQKIKDLADTQYKAVAHRVDLIYRDSIEPFQTKCLCIEEELAKMREENLKRQQAEEKMREELWGVIRKMQTEIEELKKGRARESVEERFTADAFDSINQNNGTITKTRSRGHIRKDSQPTTEDWAALEAFELSPMSMRGPTSREENVQNYTSSALVPFSSQVDKNTNAPSTKGLGQTGTPGSVVSGLDLTTRPANRGQQSVASLRNTHIADSEPTIPYPKFRAHSNGIILLASDSDDENCSESTASAKRGSTSQFSLRPGRHSQGTGATTTSRSRSPRPSLDASFRVRDDSQSVTKSKSRSTHRRSTSSSSIQSIPNDNDIDLSSQSIPSRFQPSRRTKSANELIDKHLSFIPNGWRTIIANTAKQLSPEDWDRSDARVLKKLEEHCTAFSNLEEILPDVRMAVPALRELMRELGRHP